MRLLALAQKAAELQALKQDAEAIAVKRDGFSLFVGEHRYVPSVTGRAFHASKSIVKDVMGPYGSGKSTMCVAEIMLHAISMPPCRDGVRRCKYAVIRNTYPDLKATTVRTWQDWFGDLGNPVFDTPIRWRAKFRDDQGLIDLELLFISLDGSDDLRKLKSLEITGAYLNEASELNKVIFDHLLGRINRYPKLQDIGQPYRSQIILDTNPPDDAHWLYGVFEVLRPKGFEIFKQPPALLKSEDGKTWLVNPDADNIKHLPADYYTTMILGKTAEFIKVYALGQYGVVSNEKAVYNEYNDDIHASHNLEYDPLRPIDFGFDFGLTPACVISQQAVNGSVTVLAELVSENSGLEQFLKTKVVPFLNNHYTNYKIGLVVGDPAGNSKSQTDEKTCIQVLIECGFYTAKGGVSNSPQRRIGAVKTWLTKLIDGKAAFRIHASLCPVLRKGFVGHYQLERIRGEDNNYRDEPKKNFYSHIQDAGQYLWMQYLVNEGVQQVDVRKFMRRDYGISN